MYKPQPVGASPCTGLMGTFERNRIIKTHPLHKK